MRKDYETSDHVVRQGTEHASLLLRREMPGLFRRELDIMFQNDLRDAEETWRPRVEQLMVELQSRVLEIVHESEAAPVEDHGSPEPQQTQQELSSTDPALHDFNFDSGVQGPPFCYQDDLEQVWNHDPSSATTFFQEAAFDIDFAKLPDPAPIFAGMRDFEPNTQHLSQ
jgi:hypothetical protein